MKFCDIFSSLSVFFCSFSSDSVIICVQLRVMHMPSSWWDTFCFVVPWHSLRFDHMRSKGEREGSRVEKLRKIENSRIVQVYRRNVGEGISPLQNQFALRWAEGSVSEHAMDSTRSVQDMIITYHTTFGSVHDFEVIVMSGMVCCTPRIGHFLKAASALLFWTMLEIRMQIMRRCKHEIRNPLAFCLRFTSIAGCAARPCCSGVATQRILSFSLQRNSGTVLRCVDRVYEMGQVGIRTATPF